MTEEEQDALSALEAFYGALEALISGRGFSEMSIAWHHFDWITVKHPISGWGVGWEEVETNWKAVAQFGRADRGGSQLEDSRVVVRGELAYCASVFKSSPVWGGSTLNCTDVLCKQGGAWKLVHHHADSDPNMAAALERMLSES